MAELGHAGGPNASLCALRAQPSTHAAHPTSCSAAHLSAEAGCLGGALASLEGSLASVAAGRREGCRAGARASSEAALYSSKSELYWLNRPGAREGPRHSPLPSCLPQQNGAPQRMCRTRVHTLAGRQLLAASEGWTAGESCAGAGAWHAGRLIMSRWPAIQGHRRQRRVAVHPQAPPAVVNARWLHCRGQPALAHLRGETERPRSRGWLGPAESRRLQAQHRASSNRGLPLLSRD